MKDKLEGRRDRIKELEKEQLVEVEARRRQFSYCLTILSTPMILFCAVPVVS